MTTVYIAGPMTGHVDHNLPAFRNAGKYLAGLGYDVLNPADLADKYGTDHDWTFYMRRAVRQVSRADMVVVLPGWRASKGAKLEVYIAEALGLPVKDLGAF